MNKVIDTFFTYMYEIEFVLFIIVIIVALFLYRRWNTVGITFYYHTDNEKLRNVLKNTRLSSMKYVPSLLAINASF